MLNLFVELIFHSFGQKIVVYFRPKLLCEKSITMIERSI